jgi:hypothetical protein
VVSLLLLLLLLGKLLSPAAPLVVCMPAIIAASTMLNPHAPSSKLR